MQTVILIACVSKKKTFKAKAKDLYISQLFKHSLAYAYSLKPNKIFILSALHHLLDIETEIEPYNVTLSNIPKSKRKEGLIILSPTEKIEWGRVVVQRLSEHSDLMNDQFIVLAGQEYIKPIKPYIKNLDDKLHGLRQGERIKFLKTALGGR